MAGAPQSYFPVCNTGDIPQFANSPRHCFSQLISKFRTVNFWNHENTVTRARVKLFNSSTRVTISNSRALSFQASAFEKSSNLFPSSFRCLDTK